MNMLTKFVPTLICFFLLCANNAFAETEAVPEQIEGVTRISAEKLIDLLDEYDDLVIIDARKPSDRAKGFIEDSIPLPDFDTNAATLAQHLASKSTPVIFYCNGEKCGRSVKSSKLAVTEGYSKVFWFRGGWAEWVEKGYPVDK